MFDLRADAGLQAFNLIEYRVQPIVQVQLSTPAGPHRDMPSNRVFLAALFDTLISGVGAHIRLLAAQQRLGCIDVVNVGRRTDDGMHQARVCVHADMRFHPEVPLIALPGPVHFRVSCTRAVLRRAGCTDQRSVDRRP